MSQSMFDFDLVVLGFASSSRICRLRVDSADWPSLLRRGAGSEVKRDGGVPFGLPLTPQTSGSGTDSDFPKPSLRKVVHGALFYIRYSS